jgi:hypothetical protein
MAVRLTMSLGPTSESVALDHPSETLPFRDTGDINKIAGLEDADIYYLPYLNGFDIIYCKFPEVLEHTYLLEMPFLRRIETLCLSKAKLNCIVALFSHPFNLGHDTWPGRYGSNLRYRSIILKNLGHPNLSSYNSLNHFSTIPLLHCLS